MAILLWLCILKAGLLTTRILLASQVAVKGTNPTMALD